MFFYGEGLLAPGPTPKLEDHASSAVRGCLFNLFTATLHIGGHFSIRNLRTRHAVVTSMDTICGLGSINRRQPLRGLCEIVKAMKSNLKFKFARTALAITIFLEQDLNQPILVHVTPVVYNYWPSFRQAPQKIISRLINCSPPRKSLVKGERFMRIEGKPE